MIVDWLAGRIAGPVAAALALAFALLFLWQSARIEGWPLAGGGFKAEVAQLQADISALRLSDAEARAAILVAREKQAKAADAAAAAHIAGAAAIARQIHTIIEKVPVYVTQKSDSGCVVPWGVVRLLDAAASGAGPAAVAAAVAPGQPDDAASDVKLSEAVALLAADLGIARGNADQLRHLEAAVAPVR